MDKKTDPGAAVRSADEALTAIAGCVGAKTDLFNPDPVAVYRAVRRVVREHEQMRHRLAVSVEEAERDQRVLRIVDADGEP